MCVSSGVSSALLSEVLEKEQRSCVKSVLCETKFEEVKKKTVDDQTVFFRENNNEKTSFLG